MNTAPPCERCGGTGRVPRRQRRRPDGSLDPFDILGRHQEVCDRCGGSGEAPASRPRAAPTPRPVSIPKPPPAAF